MRRYASVCFSIDFYYQLNRLYYRPRRVFQFSSWILSACNFFFFYSFSQFFLSPSRQLKLNRIRFRKPIYVIIYECNYGVVIFCTLRARHWSRLYCVIRANRIREPMRCLVLVLRYRACGQNYKRKIIENKIDFFFFSLITTFNTRHYLFRILWPRRTRCHTDRYWCIYII